MKGQKMERWHTKTFRTDDVTSKRIDALAEQEDRSISKMLDILVQEALKDRQCREMIRKAERPEFPHGEFDNGAHWMASND